MKPHFAHLSSRSPIRLAVLSLGAGLLSSVSALAVDISDFSAPDAWSRGSANTTYYGWDVFEGGPSFLNDTTPDINPFSITGASMVQNNVDFSNVRASTNLYAGPANLFDFTVGAKTDGSIGLGFTTIVIQVAGSSFGMGQTAAGFDTGSFLINGELPDFITEGYIADNRNLWWMEWILTGNEATYQVEVDTVATSGSVSKITIDTAWHPTAGLNNSDVTVVPEPASTALLIGSSVLLGLRRRRK